MARLCIVALFIILFSSVSCGRVDTHFHALPPAFVDALYAAGGDPSGYSIPTWSLEAAAQSMDDIGTDIGVLSVSAPGVPIAGAGQEGRELARTLNENLGSYATDSTYAGRIRFFGALTDWRDVEGTISEIEYLFGEQRLCSGVLVFTSYGDKLLGDPSFAPIWATLNAHKALVFIHPTGIDIIPKFLGNNLPQPIVEYPLATTRAAVDLVITGTVRAYPDVDIILAHAGGTLPFLAFRVLRGLSSPPGMEHSVVSAQEAEEDFKRFYYDTASSTSAAQLDGLLDWISPEHVVFGSDFPYIAQEGIRFIVEAYDEYVATNPRGWMVAPEVLRQNAMRLLEKHSFTR